MDKLPFHLGHMREEQELVHHNEGPPFGYQPPYISSHATMMAAAAMYNQPIYNAMYHPITASSMPHQDNTMLHNTSNNNRTNHNVHLNLSSATHLDSNNAANTQEAHHSFMTPPPCVEPPQISTSNTPSPSSAMHSALHCDDRKPIIDPNIMTTTTTDIPSINNENKCIEDSGKKQVQEIKDKESFKVKVSLEDLKTKKDEVSICGVCYSSVSIKLINVC